MVEEGEPEVGTKVKSALRSQRRLLGIGANMDPH
jgi:hypothetical protein